MAFGSNIGGSQGLGMGAQGGLPNIDPTQINQLLQAFGGMSLPDQPRPQGPFENGWLGQHTGAMGSGLDNALIALANMGPTGRTAGDNISNVARGVSAIGPTRNVQAAAQYQLPLQLAGEVAKLQEAQSSVGRNSAMADYYSGKNDASRYAAEERLAGVRGAAESRAQSSMMGHQVAASKELQIGTDPATGKPAVMGARYNEDSGQVEWVPQTGLDPDAFQKQQARKTAMASPLGSTLQGQTSYARHQGLIKNQNDIHAPENSKFWDAVQGDINTQRTLAPGIAQGGANDRQASGNWNKSSADSWSSIIDQHARGSDKRIQSDFAAATMDPNNATADPMKLKQTVQDREGKRVFQMKSVKSDYDRMTPQQQMDAGGPTGYLKSRGYDEETGNFKGSGPSGVTVQTPIANAMGAQTAAPQAAAAPQPQDIVTQILSQLKK